MSRLLLTCLHEQANAGGLVLAREEKLLERLGVARSALAAELKALEAEGAIRILSPLPYLALKLKKWSGWAAKSADSGENAYSYSKLLQPKRLNNSYRDPEPHPSQGLLTEILEALGENDAATFEKAIELYSPAVIRSALDRVRRARGIRKSRTALFRHLLPRLARQGSHA